MINSYYIFLFAEATLPSLPVTRVLVIVLLLLLVIVMVVVVVVVRAYVLPAANDPRCSFLPFTFICIEDVLCVMHALLPAL